MNLSQKQRAMFESHAKEKEEFFKEAVKEFAARNLDVVAAGNEIYNDDGGSDQYKTFAFFTKDKSEFSDEMKKGFEDIDLEDIFSRHVECGYDRPIYYKFVTSESGEIQVNKITDSDEKELINEILPW